MNHFYKVFYPVIFRLLLSLLLLLKQSLKKKKYRYMLSNFYFILCVIL